MAYTQIGYREIRCDGDGVMMVTLVMVLVVSGSSSSLVSRSDSLVRCLHDLELRVHVAEKRLDAGVWRLLRSVQHQRELLQRSTMFAWSLKSTELLIALCNTAQKQR